MANTWTNENLARVTVKDAISPSDSFSFDGIATSGSYTTPNDTYKAIQYILAVGGLSAVKSGITRTVKQGDDSQ